MNICLFHDFLEKERERERRKKKGENVFNSRKGKQALAWPSSSNLDILMIPQIHLGKERPLLCRSHMIFYRLRYQKS